MYYNPYCGFITCDSPKRINCICTKICKDFVPYLKPFVEKDY